MKYKILYKIKLYNYIMINKKNILLKKKNNSFIILSGN